MTKPYTLLVFTLDDHRYALSLSTVERVIRAVAVTSLPKAPEIVLGIINVQGQILPVLNLRRRFRLPERPIELRDQFIIAHTARRTVVLPVDNVLELRELEEQEIIGASQIVPDMEYVEGLIKCPDGMIFIHNLETFLSLAEEQTLNQALS